MHHVGGGGGLHDSAKLPIRLNSRPIHARRNPVVDHTTHTARLTTVAKCESRKEILHGLDSASRPHQSNHADLADRFSFIFVCLFFPVQLFNEVYSGWECFNL